MSRLELDSDGWARLSHAYGSAQDLPALLRRLPSAPPMQPEDDDAWYCTWSCLCHQYCVSTASYAAVPHLVEMAGQASGPRRIDFLSLVGSIEAFRHLPGAPAFPTGLKQPYLNALKSARALVIESLADDWSADAFRELLGAAAVLSGHPRLGTGISMGAAEFTCDHCGATQPLPGYAEYVPQRWWRQASYRVDSPMGSKVESGTMHLALHTGLALEACCALVRQALHTGPFRFDAENETEWGEAVAAGGVTVNVSRPYQSGTLQEWDPSVPEECNVAVSLWPGNLAMAAQAAQALSEALGETVYLHRNWTGPGENRTFHYRFPPPE